jgi:hypothetical protein
MADYSWPSDPPRALANCWRLRKLNRGEASCDLWSHPLGRELRLSINTDLLRSEVLRGPMIWLQERLEAAARAPPLPWLNRL